MAKLLSQEKSGHRIDRYWLHAGDDGKDRITVESVEDVEPIIEANKAEFNAHAGKNIKEQEGALGKRVARIPATIVEELCRINRISFRELMACKTARAQKIMNSFLNDPAFRSFRTAPGRVDVARGK